MIKVGLVGCGHIMPAHLHGYKALIENDVDVRITALCARKIEDAKRYRKPGEGPPPRKPVGPPGDPMAAPHIHVCDFQNDVEVQVYDDYTKMLKEADIDAVEIYTSLFSHHPISIASLKAGKHVLVEKPMAISVKAASHMIKAAEEANRVLGVAESARYGPLARMRKWAIDQGYIGDPQMVVSVGVGGFWAPNKIVAKTPWRHKKLLGGGGPTIDVGVHIFNVLRYYFGEVSELNGTVETIEKFRVTRDDAGNARDEVECDVDDTFIATFKFHNGVLGHLVSSWAGHGGWTGTPQTIYGTKGCIRGGTMILDDGTSADIEALFEAKASQKLRETLFPYGLRDTRALESLEFLRAIQEERKMETSGLEGLRDLAASFAVIESSVVRSSVRVRDVESGKIARYQDEINIHYDL